MVGEEIGKRTMIVEEGREPPFLLSFSDIRRFSGMVRDKEEREEEDTSTAKRESPQPPPG